jgi:hypothetical protein
MRWPSCKDSSSGDSRGRIRQAVDHQRGSIECTTIFAAGAVDAWLDFEMEEGISMSLADELHNLPEQPNRAKGLLLRSNEPLGLPELQLAWDEGFRFVMIRATVGLNTDVALEEHWEYAGQLGFVRALFHWLNPDDEGQAAFFFTRVGDKAPEMGFYGSFGGELTLTKANTFLAAADDLFGRTIHVRMQPAWIGNQTPPWQDEGRNLSVINFSNAEDPVLPNCYTTWDTWMWGRVQPPFPTTVGRLVYNGTDADLYTEVTIAQLLLAQARNAEVAAHIANALAILQGQQ